MTSMLKHRLQKELFSPIDEKLYAEVNVVKAGKRKFNNLLCLTSTTQYPVTIHLHLVKRDEKDDHFKIKSTTFLRDVRSVDGIHPKKETLDFVIQTKEKAFRWTATTYQEKLTFIKQMIKLAYRYYPNTIDFTNCSLPVDMFENKSSNGGSIFTGESVSQGQVDEELETFQPITQKEEYDFRRLLNKCNLDMGQADKFADHLTRELTVLDGENIESIMGSEEGVNELMKVIDDAINEADSLEGRLDHCDQLLQHVRESVDLMEEKDDLLNVRTANRERLSTDLNDFIQSIDLTDEHEKTLNECKLSDPANINKCTRAAQSLLGCMNSKVQPSLHSMKAYKTQHNKMSAMSEKLAERLLAHLTTLFQSLMEMDRDSAVWHECALPKHSQRHHALMPFSELVSWLKASHLNSYHELVKRYIGYMKELYARDLQTFFQALKGRIKVAQYDRRYSGVKSLGDSSTLPKSPSNSEISGESARSKNTQGQEFTKIIDTLICELEPVVIAEQKFTTKFFHVRSDASETTSVGSGDVETLDRRVSLRDNASSVLDELFRPLRSMLADFVNDCNRANAFYTFYLLANLSRRATLQEPGSFMGKNVLGPATIIVKRSFDTFLDSVGEKLGSFQLVKRTRVGVLDTLDYFREVAMQAETAFKGSNRRADLDRWYPQLVTRLCDGIEQVAHDPHCKQPPSVLTMINYHHLYGILSELKIECLDAQRKQIKQKYQENLESYVIEYMGKPMDKLSNFFDLVERSIELGRKPEEISYQQQFSKNELSKVVAAYPGKDVKRGLEQLYKKVEKHVGEDSALVQVVWTHMQDNFIQQYKQFTTLMTQCYPNSNVSIQFSLTDLLQYFSDIAMQH